MLAKGALSLLWSPAFTTHRQGWTLGKPTKLLCFRGDHVAWVRNGWNHTAWMPARPRGLGTGCLMFLLPFHTCNCLHHYQNKRDFISFINQNLNQEDTRRILFFAVSLQISTLGSEPCAWSVTQPAAPPLAMGGHGPESPILHTELNQLTKYLFIHKDQSVSHCFTKGTNKNGCDKCG